MINCQASYAHHYVPTGYSDQLRCIWCNQHSPKTASFAQGFEDGLAEREKADKANAVAESVKLDLAVDFDPFEILT